MQFAGIENNCHSEWCYCQGRSLLKNKLNDNLRATVIKCNGRSKRSILVSLALNNENLRDLKFLESLPTLQALDINGSHMLDYGTLPKMKNIYKISLNDCNIKRISGVLFILQMQCPNLEQLSMFNNPGTLDVSSNLISREDKNYIRGILNILPNLTHYNNIDIRHLKRPWYVNILKVIFRPIDWLEEESLSFINNNRF